MATKPSREVTPNLFCIGAMRCGSTTLHLLLDQHPEILMSNKKEPMYYFAEYLREQLKTSQDKILAKSELDEFVAPGKHREKDSYQKLFRDYTGQRYVGESSHYIYHPQVAPIIRSKSPQARILVMLRDPVERLISEYFYYLRSGRIQFSFDEFAWIDCTLDQQGRLLDAGIGSRISKGMYANSLKKWIEAFGDHHLKVLFYDDLLRDPMAYIITVYNWLEVDPTFRPRLIHAEKGGAPSFRSVYNKLNPPRLIKRTIKSLIPRYLVIRMRSYRDHFLLRKTVIPESTKDALRRVYFDDITDLEHLLAVDLTKWKEPSSGPLQKSRDRLSAQTGKGLP